jgi:exopolysaccharide biosynthesis polyprenyl glycosylphosphotransferase
VQLDQLAQLATASTSAVPDDRASDGANSVGTERRRLRSVGPIVPDQYVAAQSIDPATVKRRLMLADLGAIVLGLMLAFGVQALWHPVAEGQHLNEWLVAIASLPVWLFLARANHLYTSRANARVADEARHLAVATMGGVVTVVSIAFLAGVESLSRWMAVAIFCSVLFVWFVARQVIRGVFARLRRSGRMSRPILIVGTDAYASGLVRRLQDRPDLGYRAIGFVGSQRPADSCGLEVLGELDRIEELAATLGATGVMISLYSVDGPTVNQLTRRLTDAGLHVTLSSSLRDIDIERLRVQQLDGQALLYVEPRVRTGWRRTAMRAFDLTVALAALVVTLPIIAIAAVAIRTESRGPIFYRQRRIGEHGRPFEMIKLRTMFDGADQQRDDLLELNESDGPLFKIRDDPRVTRVGRVLRKFSIDEIPQFWNVVRAEMSVVGPRPALPSEVEQWSPDVHERLRVLPGITGMWQVSGRSETTFEEYKRLDMYYVDNWSLAHDVRIVLKTVWVVLMGRGAS